MTYSVLLRQNPKGGFLATALAWPNFEIEAPSREEALEKMQKTIANLLSKGEIVELEIPTSQSVLSSSYTETFGMFRDDPTFSEFVEETNKYRQKRNDAGHHAACTSSIPTTLRSTNKVIPPSKSG